MQSVLLRTIALVTVFVLFPLAVREASATPERPLLVDVSNRPPVTRLTIGPFTDTNGKGKKFSTPGSVFLDDDREIPVSGTRKWKASKLKGTYKLKTVAKALPKITISMATAGNPEAVTSLKITIKESDGSKAKISVKKDDLIDVQLIPTDAALSDDFTRDGVKKLLRGDEDFEVALARFNAALAADDTNPNPVAFRALAEFLLFLREEAVDADGELRALYRNAGLETAPAATFWQFDLDEEVHGQGAVKDSAPRGDDVQSFLRKRMVPALQRLRDGLGAVPATFEYRLSVDAGGEFFDGNPADDIESVWFDYGDVQLLRSIAQVQLAWLLFFDAYDLDDVKPEDFDCEEDPDIDVLGLLESRYDRLGRLARPQSLTSAKEHVEGAFAAYKAGVSHILAETQAEQDNGIFTPYRVMLRGGSWIGNSAEGETFFDVEGDFRSWFQGLVDRFDVNADTTITTRPDGMTIPVEDRLTVNFVEFWRGIDLRRNYLKTFEDPIEGGTVLGVTSVDDLTRDMFTANGVIVRANGVAPAAGDIAENYALRLKKPAKHTKTVDGTLSDWSASNRNTVLTAPVATYGAPRPDFGEVWLAVDGTRIYLAFTADVSDFTGLEVRVSSPSGAAGISDGPGLYGTVADPVVGLTGPSLEIGVPRSNFGSDRWVKIEIELSLDPGDRTARSGSIYVKVR